MAKSYVITTIPKSAFVSMLATRGRTTRYAGVDLMISISWLGSTKVVNDKNNQEDLARSWTSWQSVRNRVRWQGLSRLSNGWWVGYMQDMVIRAERTDGYVISKWKYKCMKGDECSLPKQTWVWELGWCCSMLNKLVDHLGSKVQHLYTIMMLPSH